MLPLPISQWFMHLMERKPFIWISNCSFILELWREVCQLELTFALWKKPLNLHVLIHTGDCMHCLDTTGYTPFQWKKMGKNCGVLHSWHKKISSKSCRCKFVLLSKRNLSLSLDYNFSAVSRLKLDLNVFLWIQISFSFELYIMQLWRDVHLRPSGNRDW